MLNEQRKVARDLLDAVPEEERGKRHNSCFIAYNAAEVRINDAIHSLHQGEFADAKRDVALVMKDIATADALAQKEMNEWEKRRKPEAPPADASGSETQPG